jgi:hypothetical protein
MSIFLGNQEAYYRNRFDESRRSEKCVRILARGRK